MNSKYERLSQSVDEDSERGDWTPRRSKHTVEIRTLNRPLKIVLVVSNTLWLLVLSLLVFALWKSSPREPRFATDLPDAQRAVRYEQRVYSQALFYNEATKQVERHVDPDEPVYFGEPSPDVDANWDTLLHGTSEPTKPLRTLTCSRRVPGHDVRGGGTIPTRPRALPRRQLSHGVRTPRYMSDHAMSRSQIRALDQLTNVIQAPSYPRVALPEHDPDASPPRLL